jgi:hypothetical protein
VKTLFFVLVAFLFYLNLAPAVADDPLAALPWHPVTDIPEVRSIASHVPNISVFREVLSDQNIPFTFLLTKCGRPEFECNNIDLKGLVSSGHFYRYILSNDGHVYVSIGTTELITLAIYQPTAGPSEFLYR